MYKARFDAQTNTYVNNLLTTKSFHQIGGDLSSLLTEMFYSEFKIYVYNAEPNNSLSVDLSNTNDLHI